MSSCKAPTAVHVGADDVHIDGVWVSLQRGDLARAAESVSRIRDPVFAERARRDVQAAQEGRPAALFACLAEGSWLAARYDASDERARRRLRDAKRRQRPEPHPAVWLEDGRRSTGHGRRVSALQPIWGASSGGPEALALEVESLLAQQRFAEAARRLDRAQGSTGRLRLAQRRLDAATGRARAVAAGVLDDLRAGQGLPASLRLLEDVLVRVPLDGVEREARELLAVDSAEGWLMGRTRDRLRARLAARAGDLAGAAATLAGIEPRLAYEDRMLRRWQVRLGQATPRWLEERIDVSSARDGDQAMSTRRLADEWSLEARATYREALDEGREHSLDDFVARLDEAASPLAEGPLLADLPRHDYGVFGQRLETEPLRARLGPAFVLSGKAIGLPADMTWFDVEECVSLPLPVIDGEQGDDAAGGGTYLECRVRANRVPGLLASQGASISGAGIDRLVFLDLDHIDYMERFASGPPNPPVLEPMPAHGADERRDLSEPLDVVFKLDAAIRADAGSDYRRRLIESLSLHEQRHILDFHEFMGRGVFGKVSMIFSGGLLPASVRAEIERRAQLYAMRNATDPRIALRDAVERVPVEGLQRRSEHAMGYAELVRGFLVVLDTEAWEGARPLAELGLDRGASLLQQLDRLDPETVRAIARAIDG